MKYNIKIRVIKLNITFLIGNGFDMGLGLKTGYKDFYQWLINTPEAQDNMIKKQIEQDKSANQYDKWSDLELALGEYTQEVCENTYEDFADDKIKLDKLLAKYIKQEREKFNIQDEELRAFVIKALYGIQNGESKKEKDLVKEIFEVYRDEQFNYRAINFNYTDCFDCFFEVVKIGGESIGHHNAKNGQSRSETVGDVLHIHGELDGKEMILGVNDETQIKNIDLLESTDIRELLIKADLNSVIGQGKIEEAKKIIVESGIICLYGVSLGDTDKMWWKYIGDWMKASSNRILIIFDYNPKYKGGHPYEDNRHKNKIKDRFLIQAGLDNLNKNEDKKIKERILVGVNRNIFEISTTVANERDAV